MALIEGTAGTIKVGPALTPTVVGFIGEWEAEVSEEVKVQGPFIGNKAKYKIRAGTDCKGSLSGYMPQGGDAGQRKLRDAIVDGTDIRFELTATNGDVLTIPLTIISKYKFGQKAEDGVPISVDFEANGGFTLDDAV